MTDVEVKTILEKYREIRDSVKSDELLLEEVRADAESVNALDYSRERVSGGDMVNSVEDAVCRICDIEERIVKGIKEKYELLELIRSLILKVDDSTCRIFLTKKYLMIKTWEVIADEMNYSVRNIANIQKRAISKLNAVIKDEDDITTLRTSVLS